MHAKLFVSIGIEARSTKLENLKHWSIIAHFMRNLIENAALTFLRAIV